MTLESCAEFLHVTVRTVRNWESGKHDIPFSAYKVLRLMTGMDIPGPTWAGWCFHSGKLWSPEGHGFDGRDCADWGLLIRQARSFPVMSRRVSQLEAALAEKEAARPAGWDSRRRHGLPDAPASGLVSVSTTCTTGQVDITVDTTLTRKRGGPMMFPSYQIDYGLISCPTPYGSRQTLRPQHGNALQALASASTHSFVFVSMHISMGLPNPTQALVRGHCHQGQQRKVSNAVQSETRQSSWLSNVTPLQTTTPEGIKINPIGASSILTQSCGPSLTRTQSGQSGETRSSQSTGTQPKQPLKPLSVNTGLPVSAPPMSSQDQSSQPLSSVAPSRQSRRSTVLYPKLAEEGS